MSIQFSAAQFKTGMSRFRAVPFIAVAALIAASLGLSGCGSSNRDPFAGVGSPVYPGSGPLPKGGGRYLVGEPYQVAGQWFTPKEQPGYDKVGVASWYGPRFNRRMTSNGEWFDMTYLSAAHPTLPLPGYARVTNLENGREIVVRINDRGPFVADRIIDLSKRAAQDLAFLDKGRAKVRVQYLGPAPIDDKGTHLAAMNDRLHNGKLGATRYAAADKPAGTVGQPVILAAAEPDLAGYFVQVGAFSDPANVARAQRRLAGMGAVSIRPVNGLYSVRLGPLGTAESARNALQQVQAAGHYDARLVLAQR
jgi:rare lipoprotein A